MSYYQNNQQILLDYQKQWQQDRYWNDTTFRKEKNAKSLEYYYKHRKEILTKAKAKRNKTVKVKQEHIKFQVVFHLKKVQVKKTRKVFIPIKKSNCSQKLSNILGGL